MGKCRKVAILVALKAKKSKVLTNFAEIGIEVLKKWCLSWFIPISLKFKMYNLNSVILVNIRGGNDTVINY